MVRQSPEIQFHYGGCAFGGRTHFLNVVGGSNRRPTNGGAIKFACSSLTDRVRYPNKDNPASYHADSSAEIVARSDAADAPSERTGVAAETSAPAAASDCPCADCTASRPRRH